MYEKGDYVTVKDGTGSRYWNKQMEKYVGRVFQVLDRIGQEYVLEDCLENEILNDIEIYGYYWLFDELWLEPAQSCEIDLKEQEIMEMFK